MYNVLGRSLSKFSIQRSSEEVIFRLKVPDCHIKVVGWLCRRLISVVSCLHNNLVMATSLLGEHQFCRRPTMCDHLMAKLGVGEGPLCQHSDKRHRLMTTLFLGKRQFHQHRSSFGGVVAALLIGNRACNRHCGLRRHLEVKSLFGKCQFCQRRSEFGCLLSALLVGKRDCSAHCRPH